MVAADESGAAGHRLVNHEQVFQTEQEAQRWMKRLASMPGAGGVVLRKPLGTPQVDRPFVVTWSKSEGDEPKVESFKNGEDAERRAEYLERKGYIVLFNELARPDAMAWRKAQLPVAGIARVKYRLTEKLPFLVMYVTEKGPRSKSFERETQAKRAASTLADEKG